jgi:hypothetical protein
MLPMIKGLIAVAICGLLSFQVVEAGVPPCRHSVPRELLATVEGGQGKWRMVEIDQLSEDDQKLWPALKRGRCPGLAVGNFDHSGRRQFAILLRSSGTPNTRLVHAVKVAAGHYETRTLFEGESTNSPVVYTGKPGKFSTPDDREHAVVLSAPPVILAVLESGETAYYFAGNELRSLLISE